MTKATSVKPVDDISQLPQEIQDRINAAQGRGMEEADKDSFATPFLRVLQSGSPQCKKSDGAYIKGAEEGMIYNNVSDEVYDGEEGVVVIPCFYQRRFVEWTPIEAGGGFNGEYAPSDPIVGTTRRDEATFKDMLPNGNELTDTRNHYCLLVLPNGSVQPVLISMASTQVKVSRKWMSMINAAPGDMFAMQYRLKSVAQSNDKNTWMTWAVEAAGFVTDIKSVDAAEAFYKQVSAGEAKAAYDADAPASSTDAGTTEEATSEDPF